MLDANCLKYLRLLDMGEPPKPNTRACSMLQRSKASRGGRIPNAHSRGRKRNTTCRTWQASWSSGSGPKNLNQSKIYTYIMTANMVKCKFLFKDWGCCSPISQVHSDEDKNVEGSGEWGDLICVLCLESGRLCGSIYNERILSYTQRHPAQDKDYQ